jgi:hypothetical protein
MFPAAHASVPGQNGHHPKFQHMNKKLSVTALVILAVTLIASICPAMDITCTNSGNWSDTNIWDGGTVPGPADTVDIPGGYNVTVDVTNATVLEIYDYGTVTMGDNSTLILLQDPMISSSTTLVATAPGNTVIYTGNPYNAHVCDYYNLVLANTNWTPPTSPYVSHYEDFNNFASATVSTATPMNIYGDLVLQGYIKVQAANVPDVPITVNGDLYIGQGCAWDCSSGDLIVKGNLHLDGMLEDLDGAHGTNAIGGSVIVNGPSTHTPVYTGGPYTNGWYLGDVVSWGIGGSLTNNGAIFGVGFASIYFNGTGSIAGSNTLTLPTITINGTYAIDDTVILTTNNADLFGTLIFDLANTNQIVLRPTAGASTTQTTYYNGQLTVINSGPAPTAGRSYPLFSAANYQGSFASENLPVLPSGLNWVDNLLTSGSLMVGGNAGRPVITLALTGGQLTLSWDSAAYPGYSVQAQTNSNGLGGIWSPTGSGTSSPYVVTLNPTNPPVFYRLSNP